MCLRSIKTNEIRTIWSIKTRQNLYVYLCFCALHNKCDLDSILINRLHPKLMSVIFWTISSPIFYILRSLADNNVNIKYSTTGESSRRRLLIRNWLNTLYAYVTYAESRFLIMSADNAACWSLGWGNVCGYYGWCDGAVDKVIFCWYIFFSKQLAHTDFGITY